MARIMTMEHRGGVLQIRYGYKYAGKLKAWGIIRKEIDVGLAPEIVADYGKEWVIWDETPTEDERRALWNE